MSRQLNQRHGYLLGKSKKGIKEVLAPIPSSSKANTWMNITNPETMHHVLLNANQKSLLKSAGSTFAEGPLFDAIGEHANKIGADELLDGIFENNSLGNIFWS